MSPAAKSDKLVIASLRGGRDGYDPPAVIPDDQCLDALNVDWWAGGIANKRSGSTALSMTFSSGGPFTGNIGSLIRHVPAAAEDAAELWAFDSAGVNGRLAGATTWTAPTFVDAVGFSRDVVGASLGGYLHLFYRSTENRSHVWDGTRVRRSGLATPDPPTVAAIGGAATGTTRWYRIRTVEINAVTGTTVRRSEPSTSVSISVFANGQRVTRPTLPTNEFETHWEAEYAAAAAGPWYRAGQIATATTTYDDLASALDTTNLSNTAGANTPPPSARYAVTDDNRVVSAGLHTYTNAGSASTRSNAMWYTPVLGSTDVGDAERVPTANFIGLEEAPTGIGGPINGVVYIFAYRRIWKFVPTGDASAPYQKFTISRSLGCMSHTSIKTGEDEFGNPALYFLSSRGPYRIVQNGFGVHTIQFLGLDVDDIWETVNLDAANMVSHTVYYPAKQQVWFSIATGANNDPDVTLIFDVKEGRADAGGTVRRGWSRMVRPLLARASVLFSSTVGATMSMALKPYFAMVQTNTIWKADTGTDDAGTAFQAYVDTKEYGSIGANHAIREGVLIAEAASGVTITITPKGDYGLGDGQAGSVSLTAAGSETRVNRRIEGMQHAGAGSFRLRIGDASAAANAWTLDALMTHVSTQEDRG